MIKNCCKTKTKVLFIKIAKKNHKSNTPQKQKYKVHSTNNKTTKDLTDKISKVFIFLEVI